MLLAGSRTGQSIKKRPTHEKLLTPTKKAKKNPLPNGEKWVIVGPRGEFCLIKPNKMPPETPLAPLYSGTYERALDAKKRAAIPSAWVTSEATDFFVIPHPQEGYLMVMPPEEFHATEQRILNSGASAQEKRQAIRQFFSAAHKVCPDKQGRVLVPDSHANAADLNGEIVFIGAGRRFEIWSKKRHSAACEANAEIYQRVAVDIGL